MKTFFKIIILLGLLVYLVFALTLFNEPKEGAICKGVETIVDDSLQTGFISENEVRGLLTRAKLFPEGRKVEEVDLKQLEDTLTASPYIDEALCYKTADNRICIRVRPLSPVLHVMSADGSDYYLDSKGQIMPRSSYCADLAVATGHITPEFARKNLAVLGRFIQHDTFWNRQIQQVNVLANGEIELIPRVGNHVILLGEATHVRKKLNRMRLFYTEGLDKVGWNKYGIINLKYDNQIICTKHKR